MITKEQKLIAGGLGTLLIAIMLLFTQGGLPSTGAAPPAPEPSVSGSPGQGNQIENYVNTLGEQDEIQIINQTKTDKGFEVILQIPVTTQTPITVNVYPGVEQLELNEHLWVSIYGIQQEITYFGAQRVYYSISTPIAQPTFFGNVSASSLPINSIPGNYTLIATDTLTFIPQATGMLEISIIYEAPTAPLKLFVFVDGKNITITP